MQLLNKTIKFSKPAEKNKNILFSVFRKSNF